MLYPLRFKEILRNYRFGNRWIVEAFVKPGLPENHPVSETWEVCDRPGESSVVVNGNLAGKTLHELIAPYGSELLGRDIAARFASRFPLLIKLLDGSNVLMEQVHHSDALAAQRGLDDPGKTEAWYMLQVREGATVHIGRVDDAAIAGLGGQTILNPLLEILS
jgi:mannose-6-phosphate isomerase